jgi:hypothetical protein
MIRVLVGIEQPPGPGFETWRQTAVKARSEALKNFKETAKAPEQWEVGVWSDAPAAYLDECFPGKCAFCEGKQTEYPIKVRHFRPIHGFVVDGYPPRQHPGYFWLAYEWYNIVPACGACVKRTDLAGGAAEGFPLNGGPVMAPPQYDPDPPDLWRQVHENEEALLLDPYSRYEYENDLTFDIETGHVSGRTKRGRETVKRFDLNRDALFTARSLAWKRAKRRLRYSGKPVGNGRFQASHEYSAYLNYCLDRSRNDLSLQAGGAESLNADQEGDLNAPLGGREMGVFAQTIER